MPEPISLNLQSVSYYTESLSILEPGPSLALSAVEAGAQKVSQNEEGLQNPSETEVLVAALEQVVEQGVGRPTGAIQIVFTPTTKLKGSETVIVTVDTHTACALVGESDSGFVTQEEEVVLHEDGLEHERGKRNKQVGRGAGQDEHEQGGKKERERESESETVSASASESESESECESESESANESESDDDDAGAELKDDEVDYALMLKMERKFAFVIPEQADSDEPLSLLQHQRQEQQRQQQQPQQQQPKQHSEEAGLQKALKPCNFVVTIRQSFHGIDGTGGVVWPVTEKFCDWLCANEEVPEGNVSMEGQKTAVRDILRMIRKARATAVELGTESEMNKSSSSGNSVASNNIYNNNHNKAHNDNVNNSGEDKCKHQEHHDKWCPSPPHKAVWKPRGRSIIELGAGTGLVSVLCFLLGAKQVVATDGFDDVVDLGRRNVDKNCAEIKKASQEAKCREIKARTTTPVGEPERDVAEEVQEEASTESALKEGEAQEPKALTRNCSRWWSYDRLEWGDEVSTNAFLRKFRKTELAMNGFPADSRYEANFDSIICSDCIFNVDLLEKFVHTVRVLATSFASIKFAIFAIQHRNKDVERDFLMSLLSIFPNLEILMEQRIYSILCFSRE